MAAPIIEAKVVDINPKTVELTGDSSKLIKYHSHAEASMTVTSDSAINMDTCIISNGNEKNIGSKSYIFENVYKRIFFFSAKDAEDDYSTTSVIPEMVDYVKLTCAITNSRPEADGTMRLSCTGNYFNGSFGAKSNSLTVTYSYTGSKDSSDDGTMTVSKSGNTYSAYVYLNDLDYEETYTFTITAKDKLAIVTSSEEGVTSVPLFHWGKNDFTFEVPVTFNGKVTFNDDVDGDFTDNSNSVDTDYGTWLPMLGSSDAVSSYDVCLGWYQRLGNVVTIGWQLKAEIYSGYEEKTLVIKNFPFTPSVNAFGGGVAFGVYTESDFIFEGWGVVYDDDVNSDTYGKNIIAARLQRCEKASSGNLQISRKCCYPKGGGTVTLAGTICYMIDT